MSFLAGFFSALAGKNTEERLPNFEKMVIDPINYSDLAASAPQTI